MPVHNDFYPAFRTLQVKPGEKMKRNKKKKNCIEFARKKIGIDGGKKKKIIP